jgi:prolyl oligopeptidase
MRPHLFTLTVVLSLAACNNSKETTLSEFKAIEVKYPTTKKDTTVKDIYFGTQVADPYRWLENDGSEETADWVKAENEVTNGYLSQIPFRDKIRKRYEELYNYEKYSAPFKEGKFTYYYKNSGLQNQSVLYREPADSKEPEIFLDPNTFSKDGTTSLVAINFSKDGSMAAYNISEGGSDWQRLIVINAITKELTGDTVDIKFGAASWKGNDGFYYSTYDKIKNGSKLSGITESHKVYYHKVGTAQKDDQLIFGSDAKPFRYISAGVSEDQQWLFLYTANETYGNGLYIQNLSIPEAPIKPVITEMKNQYGVVYNDASFFYIQTDKDAPTGKVIVLPERCDH